MLAPESRPKLARKARLRWDERERRHLLLYPERGLMLNPVGARIVELCDGEHSVAAIVAALTAEFHGARPGEIERETLAFLAELESRALVEAAP